MEKPIKLKTRKRFSALDVKAEASALSKILSGCKVNSVYDLDQKTFLIKFGKVNKRVNLVMESGVRFHTVSNFIETKEKPNSFTTRLRKHLKNLFFKEIKQIGVERVVRLTFCGADTENKEFIFHIFIELYAKGNIVFTDADYKVICLLRTYAYNDEVKCAMNERYPVEHAAKFHYDNITINKEELDGIIERSKKVLNNTQIVSRLVPCLHQSLVEPWLVHAGLGPNAKFKKGTEERLIEEAKKLLEIYKEDYPLKSSFLYTKKDSKFPFEFSPVKLNYVG